MKTSFRICAAWLMLAALLASMILPANASGSGAPFSGSGTADDPYLIQSLEDLANLATIIHQGNHSFQDGVTEFALTRDLDLSPVCHAGINWRPIGELPNNGSHKRFKYHFDGRGHVISHLYIGNPTQSCQGLFGEVGGGAVIRNLILDSTCYVSSTWNNTGGLIGAIGGSGSVLLENIGVRAHIDGASQAGGLFGIVSAMTGGTISLTVNSCYMSGSVSGTIVGPIGSVVSTGYTGTYEKCFVLDGCATLESSQAGSEIQPLPAGVTERSAEGFHSGQVAYELGGEWGQTFGENSYPDLTSQKVLYDDSRNAYYHQNRIYGVSPVLGTDLSLYIYAYLDDSHSGAFLKAEWQGESADLTGVSEGNGRYVFRFTRICPQCMTEPLNASLRLSGQENALDSLTDFKIVDYCSKMLKRTSSDREKQLLVDLVEYGTAAQRYTGYRLDQLANQDEEYLAALAAVSGTAGTDAPPENVRTLTGAANANGTRLSSIGLRYDYNNRLYLKLRVSDADADSVSVNVDIGATSHTAYVKADLVSEGEGVYRLETEPLSVTDFDKTVTFTLKVGDDTVQVLTYGVYVWCYTVGKEGSTYPAASKALAVATYRYGKATADYISH